MDFVEGKILAGPPDFTGAILSDCPRPANKNPKDLDPWVLILFIWRSRGLHGLSSFVTVEMVEVSTVNAHYTQECNRSAFTCQGFIYGKEGRIYQPACGQAHLGGTGTAAP